MTPAALIFDFDGVLLDSEFEGNQRLAQLLTDLGHPVTVEDALRNFSGLSGRDFLDAVESHIGAPLPDAFHTRLEDENAECVRDGIAAVAGAVEFVNSLPSSLPRAVASSSSTGWIAAHLDRMGIRDAFGDHLYSGREHVARGKPEPDLYLFAAQQLGVAIERCTIIEDSEVGATGALASGARVIGLAAGSHCLPGHGERLAELGVADVAHSFDEVRALLRLA